MCNILYIVFVLASLVNISFCLKENFDNDFKNANIMEYDNNEGGYQYIPPPNNHYLPPATAPLAPEYGHEPSGFHPWYGSRPHYYKPQGPIPYHSHSSWLLEKLKSKINLYTLGKILLKILILKKTIKFIVLIFLLLVLPKLKNIFKDEMAAESEGTERKFLQTDKDNLEQRIENLSEFIINSLRNFDQRNI